MSAERSRPGGEPLVSVGIPTFNRVGTLARAAESVLAQTHRNLELVISDNASDDGTAELCRALAERHPRVRVLRAPVNRGPTANFNTLFQQLRGDYVMVLSDDDWLDPDYVATCLAELQSSPDLVLVCGISRYVRGERTVKDGAEIQLTQDTPSRRILSYVKAVDENGVFYGLMRRAVLSRAAPLRDAIGNDWLLVAAVAAQGKLATVRTTSIRRELDGTSADFQKLAATLRLPRWQARVPHLAIAWQLFAEIGWRASVYGDLPWPVRVRLAPAVALAAIRWRSLAWHMTMPVFAVLGRRPRGRLLWRGYLLLARLAGRRASQPDQVTAGQPDRSG